MTAIAGWTLRSSGQALPRKEDRRLLTGKGRFTDDLSLPDQAYMAVLRSPYPHARIRGIAIEAAQALPGVLAIFTGADCRGDGLLPIPYDPVPATKYDMRLTAPRGGRIFIGPHALLPVDRVRHVGEAIVIAIAATQAQALDAADAIAVDYDALPFVLDAEAALAPGARSVWNETPDNLLVDTLFGDAAATARAFAAAAHVVAMDFHVARASPMPLEPRAALAHFEAKSGRYTLQLTSGGPGVVRQRRQYAAILGVAPERLRLVAQDVGGSFGSRNRPYVEFALALWAARKLGRPVKYTATRSEEMLSAYEGRDLVTKLALALDAEGKFLALRADNISNVGAHCVSLSPLAKGAGVVTGSYAIPVASLRARAVFSHTVPTNTMRSSGRPEVNYALERLIDTAARDLGIDRIALRRRNLIRPGAMPYTNAVGTIYDSGDYESAMDRALALADWSGAATRRRDAASRGKLLGLGLANYVESSTGAPRERAAITVTTEGRVRLVIGAQPSGQGHETTFSQLLSDMLCVPVERIDVILGDTDLVSEGGGSHSGRSMRHGATVMALAATALIDQGKRIAALALETTPERVNFADGRFAAPGSNRCVDLFALARDAAQRNLPGDLRDGLAVVADNEMHTPVFPNGCAICEVEIDPETGGVAITRYASVDDVGRCINPLIVDGQSHGSIAHGVGEALSEQCINDPQSGQKLSGSFMDYGMPRAGDLPRLDTEIIEVLSPTNPLGIKSAGEGPTTAAPAAVVNAIVDALSSIGVRDLALPATPQTVWRAIQAARVR